MPDSKATFEHNPSVPCTEIDGEIVLMNIQTGHYYSLAGSAASIWKAIGGCATLDSVCASLMTEYAVAEETCRREVSDFLNSLAEHRLIQPVEA